MQNMNTIQIPYPDRRIAVAKRRFFSLVEEWDSREKTSEPKVGSEVLTRAGLKLDIPFAGDAIGYYAKSRLYGEFWITNVPRLGLYEAPEGHRWGETGPGATDLALDIITAYRPYDGRDFPLAAGPDAPEVAGLLAGDFAREIVAPLNRREPMAIRGRTVVNWLRARGFKPSVVW